MAVADASLKIRHPVRDAAGAASRRGGLLRVFDGRRRWHEVREFVCCSDHGRSMCECCCFLFTMRIWTLSLGMDEPFEWVKDDLLDYDVLWMI
jgi:hypothetical protein